MPPITELIPRGVFYSRAKACKVYNVVTEDGDESDDDDDIEIEEMD